MKTLTREDLKKVFPTVPFEFLKNELAPFGTTKFKGDSLPKNWSINDKFETGKEYPVYYYEGIFVVGNDGKGYKIGSTAWTKVKDM